jgi:hypothetical protein
MTLLIKEYYISMKSINENPNGIHLEGILCFFKMKTNSENKVRGFV